MIENRRRPPAGFTLIELMISTVAMMAVVGAILVVANPARATFQAQGDVIDMHQRLRAAVDLISADLRSGSGVRPYRVGGGRDDSGAGVYFRPGVITVLGLPSEASAADATSSRTYYLKTDPVSGVSALMQFDGRSSDLPAVDGVTDLSFEYVADAQPSGTSSITLAPDALVDGPWSDNPASSRFDLDLLRVSAVRVHLRVDPPDVAGTAAVDGLLARPRSASAERYLPPMELELLVALRARGRDSS